MQETIINNDYGFKPIVDKKTNNDIYTNLDSILDTRLATFFKYDKKTYKEIMSSIENIEKYLSRKVDAWGAIDSNIFNRLYAKRDKSLIAAPIANRIPLLIRSYIATILETSKKIPKLYINVFPYQLSLIEKEVLSKRISIIYQNMVDVEIIDLPESSVTVKFMHENIGLIIMYNGLKWIEYHLSNKTLLSLNLPDITMLVPKIMNNNIFKKDQIDNVFKDQEKTISPFVQLAFITPRAFSIKLDTDKLKKQIK